jgi:hypothetical protein
MTGLSPRRYFCKRHDRHAEIMTFPDANNGQRSTAVCPSCLDHLRAKYRAAVATASGPRGLFDGLPAREAQPC